MVTHRMVKKTDEIKHKAVNVRLANEAAKMQHSLANEQHTSARTHTHIHCAKSDVLLHFRAQTLV